MISLKDRNLIAEAQSLGSTAKTRKGAIRFLITYRKERAVALKAQRAVNALELERPIDYRDDYYRELAQNRHAVELYARKYHKCFTIPQSQKRTIQDYKASEAQRTKNAEAKRAANEPRFRKAFARRLRAEAERLRTIPPSLIEYGDSYSARRDRLKAIEDELALAGIRKPIDQSLPGFRLDASAELAHEMGMRGFAGLALEKWDCAAVYGPSRIVSEAGSWMDKHDRPTAYSYAKYWSPGRHICYLRAFGVLRDAQTLDYVIHTTESRVALPEQYEWVRDENGLALRRVDSHRDDYHPSIHDLRSGADALVNRLETNRARRLEMATKLAAEKASLEGVYVCAADSVRAGNCLQGTKTWAQNSGLDPSRHYPAGELLELAVIGKTRPDYGRLRLAITAAVIQHRKDVEHGYALLSEHRV